MEKNGWIVAGSTSLLDFELLLPDGLEIKVGFDVSSLSLSGEPIHHYIYSGFFGPCKKPGKALEGAVSINICNNLQGDYDI